MRFYQSKLGINIVLEDIIPTTLIIEDPKMYSYLCNDIWKQSEGEEGETIISEKEKALCIKKDTVTIFNPFALNCNDKKILNALYKELVDVSREWYYEESSDILSKLVNYLDKLTNSVQYPIKYNPDMDYVGLYKLFDVSVDDDSQDLLEKIINYIKMYNRIVNNNIVISIGLKRFLNDIEIEKLYKELQYEKIYFLNIENVYDGKNENEQVIVIDKDLCKIDIN